jgi:hypothetical protein
MGYAAGGGAAAAAAAALARAIKASGAIVRLEPDEFRKILDRQEAPIVVQSTGGLFRTVYKYLTSYKGLAFFTKSAAPLNLPGTADLILSDKIWVPE